MERLVQLTDTFDDWLGIAFGFLSAEQIAAGVLCAVLLGGMLLAGIPAGWVILLALLALPLAQMLTLAGRALRTRSRLAHTLDRPSFARGD